MKINLLSDFRKLAAMGRNPIPALVEAARYGHTDRQRNEEIGKWLWDTISGSGDDRSDAAEICGTWPGWPQCSCGCECNDPATCTDDGGNACCAACADYTCDDDGCVVCSKDDRTETVTESCGAGNQQRSYIRLKPPTMPETDDAGEHALYWDTCGDGAGVRARFTTQQEAEQAVAAKDWPRPGDNTHYLCGWTVRQLVDGEWMPS